MGDGYCGSGFAVLKRFKLNCGVLFEEEVDLEHLDADEAFTRILLIMCSLFSHLAIDRFLLFLLGGLVFNVMRDREHHVQLVTALVLFLAISAWDDTISRGLHATRKFGLSLSETLVSLLRLHGAVEKCIGVCHVFSLSPCLALLLLDLLVVLTDVLFPEVEECVRLVSSTVNVDA